MQTMRVTERTGKDGVLHINLPVGLPDADVEVVLIVQPKTGEAETGGASPRDWPPGYFESTFGAITDDTFVRPPQGELPSPVEFD